MLKACVRNDTTTRENGVSTLPNADILTSIITPEGFAKPAIFMSTIRIGKLKCNGCRLFKPTVDMKVHTFHV